MRLCGATVLFDKDGKPAAIDTRTSAWKIVYPTPDEMWCVRAEFAKVSRTFDRMFYRSGKRRTDRDNCYYSIDALARHNMVSRCGRRLRRRLCSRQQGQSTHKR